jgi:transketolase
MIKGEAVIAKREFQGRNFHFGVREHAMGSICNGMALYGGWIPYTGTFLVFADYMRPAIRLAALMHLQVVFVFTHDSIFVGEDGPTHQPVEQIASLRAIPGLVTLRPADPTETAASWAVALRRTEGPTALCLTRQGVNVLDRTVYPGADNVGKGAYVLSDCQGAPDILLIATGSEVHLALQAQSALVEEGTKTRVVSMPSQELFEAQDRPYRESVLPPSVTKRVVIEAASPFGWDRYLSTGGLVIGIEGFGKSAPHKVLGEHFGLTAERVLKRIRETLC